MQAHGVDGRVIPLARPNRPALVIPDLAELTGPTEGTVELPLRLAWSPPNRFDLAVRDDLLWMYEIVLREAVHPDELRLFLDGPTLTAVWARLNLPRGVRQAWAARHPLLRQAA